MVELPPVCTLAGSATHEIEGERGCFTVNVALQDARPLLPSLKLAFTAYAPGCKPVVSICVQAPVPATLSPVPLQVYLTVRLVSKLDPVAVAVTVSPAKTSVGCTEQAALGATAGSPPPNKKLRPVCNLTPRISVVGTAPGAKR